MRRKLELEDNELNIWVAFTDLMSNAFLILSLFLITSFLISITKPKDNNQAREKRINELEIQIGNYQRITRRQEKEMQSSKARNDTPPIIFLSASKKIKFKPGTAGLEKEEMLKEFDKDGGIIDIIEENANKYNINLVEIIGHTDNTAIEGDRKSTLDQTLPNIADNIDIDRVTIDSLTAGSNADLGLMRAVEIRRILRYHQAKNRLKNLEFRTYSAAQLFPPKSRNSTKLIDDDKRRIEIRFTRIDENNTISR